MGRVTYGFIVLGLALGSQVWAAAQTVFLNSDATERVIVEQDPRLNPSAGITIELWIRPSSLDASGCETLVGKGFQSGYWFGTCNSGRLRYYANGDESLAAVDGTGLLPVGEWSHAAVSYDGANVRFYINGELDRTVAVGVALPANSRALGFGGEGSSPIFPNGLFPFSGYLSEVRLWDHARSETDIRRAMYQQITEEEPGLIGVWALEGGVDDRLGRFATTLAPGASFSGLDSPPVAHDPLVIRSTSSITADGFCNDPGYQTATRVPTWYHPDDIIFGEVNPEQVLFGADSTYLYVCLDDRNRLNDSIYTVEIDTGNGGEFTLQPDDYRFRYWPGNDGLTTARGQTTGSPPFLFSTWVVQGSNPAGLFADDSPGIEFVTDMEMRIPRSVLPSGAGAIFGIRVAHNYLINGGLDQRNVDWPFDTSSTSPASWQMATIDLSPPPNADYRNPSMSGPRIADDTPAVSELLDTAVSAFDDVDIEVLEVLVDGAVVESCNFPGSSDRDTDCRHMGSYSVGPHTIQGRAFDQAGRMGSTRIKSFRTVVDGEPPSITLSIGTRDPRPGQTVILTARAEDPSGIDFIQISDALGMSSPGFNRCDFDGTGTEELCLWSVRYDPAVVRARFVAFARDSEGLRNSTSDHVVLFGNNGPDRDADGLSDRVEAGLCTDPGNPDTDDDGLSDSWEVQGIRFADGSVEQLLDYGVNPCWKNALLQLDYETGAQPPIDGRMNLINQYRANGVSVYLEVNERPRPTAYPQSHIGAPTATYQMDDGEYYFDPKRNWAFFYGYERNLPGRSGAWSRFFTVDHNIGSNGNCSGGTDPGKECRGDFECPGVGASCVAGCRGGTRDTQSCSDRTDCPREDGTFAACSVPCVTDFSAGSPRCPTIGDLPYRLFHEFGHTVGLGHGGWKGSRATTNNLGFITKAIEWDSRNHKPNHQSVMNYLYSQGEICMEPIPGTIPEGFVPRFIGQVTYMERSLGGLNENSLTESSASTFSRLLRTRDCSYASPSAIPVFKYTCKFSDVQYEVISDGVRTLARRPSDGAWDYSPPTHSPGIDWNCNGTIDVGTVAENVDGPGWYRSDGFWDEAAWNRDSDLAATQEFQSIPNPVNCQLLYRANCTEREKSCYVFPESYRNQISTLASGLDPVDCRPIFLANRASISNCGGGSDSEFGTGTCPAVDRDSPVSVALQRGEVTGWDDMAAGVGSSDSDQFIEVADDQEVRPLPGVEQCDLADNDGDGEVDEGCADTDSDSIPDVIDNCIDISNTDQTDRDSDGLGEACQFPAVESLSASWDGDRAVNLSWSDNGIPLLGFTVYRHGLANPDAVYRGDPYPTTVTSGYADTVSFGDNFTYVVRPVNLNGVEGEGVMVSVQVDIDDALFADSFE